MAPRCRRGRRRSRAPQSPSRIGPPMLVNHKPTTPARTTARPIATSSCRSVTSPAAATRIGPVRPGESAPRRKSDKSLARLAAICSSSATARQPIAASSRNEVPSASAAPSPTTTPLIAAGRVAGRMASSQIRNGDGRAATPGPGATVGSATPGTFTGDAGTSRSRACASRGTRVSPRVPRPSCSRDRWHCRRIPGARPGRPWPPGTRT